MPEKISYRFNPRPEFTEAEILEAMKEWLYQCSEGDVPKRQIFKRIAKIIESMERTAASAK